MPLVAELEHTVAGPIEAVFTQFIDYRGWEAWMPPIFRPLRGPSRPLRGGDWLLVKAGGAPSLIKVERVEAPHEVVWSGGVPGFLHARHAFTFEALGPEATRIRSVEPWTGLLTRLPAVAARLKKSAEIAGRQQVQGFDRWFNAKYATFPR
jgi:hypothetical protein